MVTQATNVETISLNYYLQELAHPYNEIQIIYRPPVLVGEHLFEKGLEAYPDASLATPPLKVPANI